MNPTIKTVLVIGSGGVGSFYGGRLSKAGLEVSFLCRSDFHQVKSKGITIKSYQGDFLVTPAQVVARTEDYQGKPDLVLIATKVLAETNLVELLRPLIAPGVKLLLIQNGIEVERELANAYPNTPLLSAIAFIGVNKTGPGQIHHQLHGRLEIGAYPHGWDLELDQVMAAFEPTGLSVKRSTNIEKSRWKKLIWNAAFNPVSVLGLANTQQILTSPQSRLLLKGIMSEILAIANSRGLGLSEELIEQNIRVTEEFPPYKTSMLLDFEAHRPLEIESILGNPIRLAKESGVLVPHLETLQALLKLRVKALE